LAAAIVAAAKERNLTLQDISDFISVTGNGVRGTVDGRKIVVGNARLFDALGVAADDDLAAKADDHRSDGATAMHVILDNRHAGVIAVSDPIKETTPDAINSLKKEGIRIIMVTGDNRRTAEAIARRLGIDEIEADVMPEDKNAIVQRLKTAGAVVAVAGDGVNDAPALAAADVGIAMGTGTDVAMENSGITLVKGDLAAIVRAIKLSRVTMRNIRQNLFFAFFYNALGVPVAAGVLYPVVGLLLSPIIAAAAMSLSSVSVIGNALRLRRQAI
jgi:Cu+-exporting ATPase